MSRFLRNLRQESDKSTDDLYAEERRESQVQLTELWNILNGNPHDASELQDYVRKWSERKTSDAATLHFDSVGADGMKPLHWYD